jgi:acetyl esterase/lipase
VPYQTSVNFQAKLRAAGVRCDLITIPGAPHGLQAWEKFSPGYTTQFIDWLRENLK